MKFFYTILDLIFIYLTPIIMLGISIILKKKKYTNINSANGYSSPYCTKSQEVWDYAQKIAPELMMKYALILTLLTTILHLLLILIPSLGYEVIFYFSNNSWIVFLPIYFFSVERKLRKNFDENGLPLH